MFYKILFWLTITYCFSPLLAQNYDTLKTETKLEVEDDPEIDFMVYEGKVIRNIQIRILDILGPSIDEKNGGDTTWIDDLTNSVHLKTREWVVRNWLLFSEGDTIKGKQLAESERLLRSTGFFLDAKIRVINISEDTTDIFVIAQDRWTLTLNISYSTVNESYFGIEDDNLLGFGHRVDAAVTHSNDVMIGLGGRANYTYYNIAGTFVNGGLRFQTNRKFNTEAINFTRPFLTTELDWAGGVEFTRESNKLRFEYPDISLFLPYKVLSYDAWVGRSFPLWFGDMLFKNSTRLILSGRINRLEHTEKPGPEYGLSDIFENNTLYLLKGGIINRRFYKDYYIEGFGHTEDVPIGGILAATFGTDKRGSTSRIYTGFRGVYSRRILNFGYASLLVDFGGFKKGSVVEQTVYNFNFLYHSPLFKPDPWKFRFFMRGDYLLGFKRFEGEQLYLNEDTGVRGIEGFGVFGSKRAVINLETRIFSPLSIIGFILGGSVYADLGLITGEDRSLVNSRLYQGYGAGLRISNESIARAQFEIGFIYNPYTPTNPSGSFSLVLSGSFIMGIRNFEFLRPSVIGFKDNN